MSCWIRTEALLCWSGTSLSPLTHEPLSRDACNMVACFIKVRGEVSKLKSQFVESHLESSILTPFVLL